MSEMPPDPFAGDMSDFLPMAASSFKMYQAALMAGFNEVQAMQWTLGIVNSMIGANLKKG